MTLTEKTGSARQTRQWPISLLLDRLRFRLIFAGFMIFTTTYLVNTVWFGALCAFATVLAFLADVLVAPALMVVVTHRDSVERSGRGTAWGRT